MKYYAGIGSRSTPEDILARMYSVAVMLGKNGYTLRSGGAEGADGAFERGCDSVNGGKEIFLPWKNFNGNNSLFYNSTEKAIEIASKFHPNWFYLKDGAKKLHARNSHQILGLDLRTPVDFVICWTKVGGGTEQALRIARKFDIPVINMYNSCDYMELIDNFVFFN